jgi:hypothetical protein
MICRRFYVPTTVVAPKNRNTFIITKMPIKPLWCKQVENRFRTTFYVQYINRGTSEANTYVCRAPEKKI